MRRPRCDEPGSWHHVINRAIARRTLFEGEADIRFFLAGLASAVRRRRIEVHAYAILSTHFHLLVRSPEGMLAEVMRDVEREYVRRFNRLRKRDGPLVRGRYLSKPVVSLAYRRLLVRYIDANPVRAALVARASEYPFASAHHYARRKGPAWLARAWIEEEARLVGRAAEYDPVQYAAAFGGGMSEAEQRLVEARIRSRAHSDPADTLVRAAPDVVRDWMARKSRMADGTEAALPVVDAAALSRLMDHAERQHPSWRLSLTRKPSDPWPIMRVALLRDLAGCSYPEIAVRVRRSIGGVHRLYRMHVLVLQGSDEYAQRVAIVACLAMRSWRQC